MIKNIKWLFLASLTIVACSKDCETTTVYSESSDGQPLTRGTADFSKYVAVGNSLTSGYSDGALFIEGQKVAYTSIMAQQFATVGGGEFKIPFMSDNLGGFSATASGPQIPQLPPRLYYTGNAASPLGVASGVSSTVFGASIAAAGPYNNVGVPGAKCIHLVTPGYATANPYFGRFATSSTQTILNYATTTIAPTFFSCWIGNNDVLGYATNGADPALDQITPSVGAAGTGFDASYDAIVNGLTANGAKGVLANLPYVTTIPYFYVVKYDQLTQANLTVSGSSVIPTLNAQLYTPLSNALTFLGQGSRIRPLSTTGNNPMLMVDETLTDLRTSLTAVLIGGGVPAAQATALGIIFGQARQTVATDLICLRASTRIGQIPTTAQDGITSPSPSLQQLGITFPLPDRYVLVPSEVAEIKLATDTYNAKIQAVATAKGLAFVDANALMSQIASTGIVSNGYNVSSTFITGGGFSTDGVHPSPRGYALIANKFIEVINAKYGSNIKGVNIGNYRILFPAVL
jgi:hypothetical protein